MYFTLYPQSSYVGCHGNYALLLLAKMANADPEDFIQGMQGYQWTDADLEFVYEAKQQKRAQRLQVKPYRYNT